MNRDYKATVFLPRTDFPMRANLAEREPEILARWRAIDLHALLRADAKARAAAPFVLHDGPPYANGNIHTGTALNKILKDVINRARRMDGFDSVYVPGWDCHGLPIEWKIEEQLRAEGKDKNAIDPVAFRTLCREFAREWIDVQRGEFQRLGVLGDWDHPYLTMDFAAEAAIYREFCKFLMDGQLYRGSRPVLWSVVEQTALADAEVEYHDHTSTTIHVRFEVLESKVEELVGAGAVIWTTTPWTIPGNRAIAYNRDLAYALIQVTDADPAAAARPNDRLLIAADLVETVLPAIGVTGFQILERLQGDALEGTVAAHPWRGRGYDFMVPLLPGDHVTADQGTGLVHTAPGHGLEDFEVGRAFGLEVPFTVDGDGTFYPHVPLVAGEHVFKVDHKVAALLRESGALLAKGKLLHSYPHSWRSKAPLIFRNTPQWFISMEKDGLRAKALAAIDETRWVPPQGRNRIASMIEQRPDWCISRQRLWGVPLAVFLDRRTGEPLRDPAVNARIAAAFEREGGDAWYARPAGDFLGPDRDPTDYEQVRDVIEVWFDSGSTHAFVLESGDWPDVTWPADLYLEGSDQHRGWFHTSLLEACGTRGQAPFKAVLTHGFLLDEQGRKMSKSLGNTLNPMRIAETQGIDILRLWVVGSDYSEDLKIGPEILKHQADLYRRLRNTLRYLLGALEGWTEREALAFDALPELERWVLHRLATLEALRARAMEGYEFHRFYAELHAFCASDLSAFYFDVRKDALYCDTAGDPTRRAARTVFAILLDTLILWLAPVLCFTAEEAWSMRPGHSGDAADSVHRRLFPAMSEIWRDDALGARWDRLRDIRRVVTGAIELERANKVIGASLQAWPTLYLGEDDRDLVAAIDLATLCIVSGIDLAPIGDAPAESFRLADVPDVAVRFARAEASRCERCWKYLPEVGKQNDANLCRRCDAALASA